MRKCIVTGEIQGALKEDQTWLDLEMLAQAVLSSENSHHPIEEALRDEPGKGWRANEPGEQTVAIFFDRPVSVSRILVEFHEKERTRTQEFLLRWSADGHVFHDIVRQQYNFSQPGSTVEREEYTVDLWEVKALELKINPDVSRGDAVASLTRFRVAGRPL